MDRAIHRQKKMDRAIHRRRGRDQDIHRRKKMDRGINRRGNLAIRRRGEVGSRRCRMSMMRKMLWIDVI